MPRCFKQFVAPLVLVLGLMLMPCAAVGAPAAQDAGADHATHAVDDHAAHGGGGHGEGSLFSTDAFSYVWNLLMFLILFGVLAKFVWPVILKGLKDREQKQRDDLKAAEQAAADAQKTLAEYKQQLADAQKEAHKIIEQSRTQAQEVGAQLKAQAEADAQTLRQRTAADIEAAKEQAIADIYAHAAEMATQVAGKILKRELSASDQQALVDQSLKEFGELNRN